MELFSFSDYPTDGKRKQRGMALLFWSAVKSEHFVFPSHLLQEFERSTVLLSHENILEQLLA